MNYENLALIRGSSLLLSLVIKSGLADSCVSDGLMRVKWQKYTDMGKKSEQLMLFAKHCHVKCEVCEKGREPTRGSLMLQTNCSSHTALSLKLYSGRYILFLIYFICINLMKVFS